MTRRSMLLALGLVLLLAGCGGSGSSTPPPSVAITGDPVPLTITAKDITLAPATMQVPSGRQLDVTFENQDAGVPHDLVLKGGPGFSMELIKTEISTGPKTSTLTVPGLVPGLYQFTCNVHPNMTADLTVMT